MRLLARARWVAVAVVAAALVGPGGGAVGAQAGADAGEAARRQLREAVGEASPEEARLLDELATLDAEVAELDGEVAALDGRLAGERRALRRADAELDRSRAEATTLARRRRDTAERLTTTLARLRTQAVGDFMRGGGAGSLGARLEAGDIQELRSSARYADAAVESSARLVIEVADLRDELAALEERAEEAVAAAAAARTGAERRRNGVEAARDEVATRRDDVLALVADRAAVLERARARRDRHEAEVRAGESLSLSIGALLSVRQAGQEVLPALAGRLVLPVRTARLTSPFGPRTHPIYGTVRLHAGLDLAAPPGTPVFAAEDGVVVSAGRNGGYGLAVVVDHGGALATLYAHLSAITVRPGDRLARGRVLGAVGSTGASTGPHLHFETRVRGTPVDPVTYLRRRP